MSSVEIGNYGELTNTMLMDAVKVASASDNREEEVPSTLVYSDDIIEEAVNEHQSFNKRILAKSRFLGVSDTAFLDAVKVVISKRRKLIFFLHPLRSALPKWLLKDLPIGPLSFLENEIKWLKFFDELFSKFRRI
jgi:hypothetical protein